MTLSIGNRVGKLVQRWDPETKKETFPDPPELVKHKDEAYVEFEVLGLTGDQGSPDGFQATLKKIA